MFLLDARSYGCGTKQRCQNGTLVSGNMDQNLRNPSGLILSHTHMSAQTSLSLPNLGFLLDLIATHEYLGKKLHTVPPSFSGVSRNEKSTSACCGEKQMAVPQMKARTCFV